MPHKSTLFRHFFDQTDLPEEPVPGEPVLELLGDGRVLIENHGGVTQYCMEQIQVRVRYGALCVIGRNLRLRLMTAEKLVVCGAIERIELTRGRIR